VRRAVHAVAAVILSVGSSACLGAVSTSELPDEPIAFTYRTPEEARRRAEDMIDAQERGRTSAPRASRPGYNDMHATADGLTDYLSRLAGRERGESQQHQGRLALLDARTDAVTLIEAARRGSIPLAWSADHERLLFAQPGHLDFQLYEYDRTRETVRPVTHAPPAHTQGCYAGDGRIVVVAVDTRTNPPESRLALSERGGRRPFRKLTEGPADHSPACSSDGETLVFVRELAPGRSEIRAQRLDESESRRLSPGQHPVFSQDGKWVVFAAPYQRELRIWRIRSDGTGRTPIGRGVRHEARPAISPDGRVVAYVAAEEPPRRHLYLRRFDGSGDRILFADGDGEYPVW
jgi:Tol biopolymer transport system component